MWSHVLWDPAKDRLNQVRHGVAFTEAESAMRDPLATIEDDEAHSLVEARITVVGTSTLGRLLVVAVAEVSADTVRIITARRPTRRERHAYENR